MYELLIVGGGMSGISVGHFFRDRNILILEKGDLLSGATGNNAGFIVSGFGEHFNRTVARWGMKRAVEIQNTHIANHQRIRVLCANIPCNYSPGGSLSLALDPNEEADLRESLELLREQKFPVEWLENPPAGVRANRGALFNPQDASIDSARFWSALAEGLPIQTRAEVLRIEELPNGYRVATIRGDFEAEKIVFCMNAFSASLVPGLSGRYIPLRGQMVEIALAQTAPSACPVMTQYGDIYWRFTERSLMFGGLEDADEEVGIATIPSQRITRIQLDWIQEHFSASLIGLNPHVLRTWCSTMAFTVDGFPFVGPLPQRNCFVLAGLCGLGHGYAMECASWLHEYITKRRDGIPAYFSSARIESLPLYQGGDWRKLYEAWNHGVH